MYQDKEILEKLPQFLPEMLEKQYGSKLAQEILEGYGKKRKTTLRVNLLKSSTNQIETKLKENGIEFENVSWSKEAFIIKNVDEKNIQELEVYEKGEIYLQSLSSMLPPIILEPQEGEDILDMAAAPGGKTTQMASISQNKAHITACELNGVRAERLKYNLEKQGATGVFVMQKDARKLDDFFAFDKILLDAPCSGSGTLNIENPKLKERFTIKLIQKSITSQEQLLAKALKLLKPGKEIVYSTCSILEEENEKIIEKVLKNSNCEIVPIHLVGMNDLPLLPTKMEGTICVKPTELYEGFFVAKLRKK